MKDLHDYRKSYEKSELLEHQLTEDPINLFNRWFHEMEAFGGTEEVNAMTVSTFGLDGYPKSRVVLLKKFDENGFVFFTNYESEKGRAMANNPKVCLSFFWHSMERQVIIKGIASKVADNISDNYFASRPLGSQLGALASNQSEIIENRTFLENKLKQLEENYKENTIQRPDFWGGYIVSPVEVEFWQGRPNRLHDRIRFQLKEDFSWKIDRLSP
ncbi:pyridoxamine 5'-phosphate oxidase [Flavobacterium branchiophilum NBRC 15030 = ATCC 35035]|uniref:Pyridoxine/pyridoxamine 5'-phosphate oxidase n=2 Tax=Flavobacterium branchiophilum TaxID=55197 RepID=G2Z1B2_FLABF|nr:pyridoxamine 5'-phosphate oxidase [Flavobacterium branchiophilum]OXA75984.1 pyridoxamine 5'-phosphate oxidase [Flavobacterium branchiophilum NBRC 15030 = ATCC 35035]PDS26919.1 pyridoxamine 5'-phosphate oxidase [Flavobacterium branchiophilum]TQM42121.1 pyridoxamine 5'-phosphate oxidase [Flavobacterium branchiophilum]CCB69675.1 Pyridoxamine 5'-phosphate oxidase [Flavobacterium branchiophilum FL-15]GEM53894.1 pyridoxine/pyridoxamine 5'-phosphate oxidase [Flavobacterium branchiophilum NBRC 1503